MTRYEGEPELNAAQFEAMTGLASDLFETETEYFAREAADKLEDQLERMDLRPDQPVFHSVPTDVGHRRLAAEHFVRNHQTLGNVYRVVTNQVDNNYDGNRGVRVDIDDYLISPLNMSISRTKATFTRRFSSPPKYKDSLPPLIRTSGERYYLQEFRNYVPLLPREHSSERTVEELLDFRDLAWALTEFISRLGDATRELPLEPED